MKLVSLRGTSHAPRGWFGPEDGPHLILDFNQGAYGRAFCLDRHYDLPDPRTQLVTIKNHQATLEVIGGHGSPASLGEVEVATLKATGNVRLAVARAKRFDLCHSRLEANEVSGPKEDYHLEPQSVQEILMRDSRLSCRGELNFLAIVVDDDFDSYLSANYLEGVTAQGRLLIQTDHLMVGLLEAREVQVARQDGCRVAQIFCDRILLQSDQSVSLRPIYDRDLVALLNNLNSLDLPDLPVAGHPEMAEF